MEHNKSGQLRQSWDDLPQDALFFIFSYLEPVELAHIVSRVCRSWNAVANHNEIWRPKCIEMCLHNPLNSSNGLLFKDQYTAWYKEFSRYTDVYPVIKPLFDRFQTWAKKNIPRMLSTFEPGATESHLTNEEGQIASDFSFPKGKKLPKLIIDTAHLQYIIYYAFNDILVDAENFNLLDH